MTDRRSLHRFFVDHPLERDRAISLPGHASDQIRKVLRLGHGHRVVLFDGSGLEAVCKIVGLERDAVLVELTEDPEPGQAAPTPEIQLGLALLKSDRFELVIQKATELGVSSIVPLETERCVVSLSADRARSRIERWRRIATEALEQSGRADFVRIEPPSGLSSFIRDVTADRKMVAWERERVRSVSSRIDGLEKSVALTIGPEGGFTEAEIQECEATGFTPVSLGDLTLRSETAAIAGVAMIRAISDTRRQRRMCEQDDVDTQ